MLGNVIVWKPSPMATYSNYIIYQILREAGLPAGVIQFVPGPPAEVVAQAIAHPSFAALHFTGSTFVFKKLWKDIAMNIDKYKGYPRIVGETGGKNFHLVHPSADVDNVVFQTIRGAFEYQVSTPIDGQKCSACQCLRLYVPYSLWNAGFKDKLVKEVASIKVGPFSDFTNYIGPVIGKPSFDKIRKYLEDSKKDGAEILVGGKVDGSKGFFVHPTVIETRDPKSKTMVEEIFGPVLTVYVYQDGEFEQTCDLVNSSTEYGLTGSIFSNDRAALVHATNKLRNAAGNVYYNEKSTGAVVGQQPFGGGRASGTNDKAGSVSLFYRFVSARSIKENFVPLEEFAYPSNASTGLLSG